jgi:hypothetical protein
MRPGNSDEAESTPRYTVNLSETDLFKASFSSFEMDGGKVSVKLDRNDDGYQYAYVTIPKSGYENARYRIVLKKEGSDRPLAQRVIRVSA